MKKITLSLGYSSEFEALGISTAARDYKLCFLLNKSLGMNFSKNAEIKVFVKSSNTREAVACHFYEDEEYHRKCYLVKNRQELFFVSPNYKQADFILMVYASEASPVLDDFKKALNALSIIQSTFAISKENLNNIEID